VCSLSLVSSLVSSACADGRRRKDVFEVMGLIPGILVLLLLAVLTTWSGYVVGTFKLRHRSVHSIADVGFLFFGPVGREVFGLMYWLCKYLHADSEEQGSPRISTDAVVQT
jgi:hypothetical protein